ncbi:hypothetical protein POM88_016164 [Heracleum sosnowskyi]|uniref:Uncharacterized protein n=1 Tax=Heracleum sosnowskyi TaxID=360622 RepID=A0AAD8INB7_9APIA|nr:hypothetical protein POM88_016164 [Heracleum sosnowskyi]
METVVREVKLENETELITAKNNLQRNSGSAFVEELLEDHYEEQFTAEFWVAVHSFILFDNIWWLLQSHFDCVVNEYEFLWFTAALHFEMQKGNLENEIMVEDVDELKATLLLYWCLIV